MRLYKPAAVVALALLAAACGKKEEPVMPAAENAPLSAEAPPAPAVLTDAQKASLASLPAPFNTADPEDGRRQFGQCRSCHSITEGGPNMTGPNLWGVYGRKAATEAGYSYSDGLKAAGWTWDAGKLDAWIKNPRALVPDTKMTFLGVKDDKRRADIVAFLKLQGGK
jgi:cytochrome c